jgi:hypothetical protein
VDALLAIVNVPVAAPEAVGSNTTFSVAVWLELKVSGKLTPETVKPVPVAVAPLTVTDEVPVEVRVIDWVAGEFRPTLPKPMLDALMLNVGTVELEPSCSANVFDTLPALAVSVTVAGVLTFETVAVKFALVAPAPRFTVAGTVVAELLLARLIAIPPLAAAAFSVTVQLSVPALVIVPLVQLNPLSTGTPVPLRLIAVEVPE